MHCCAALIAGNSRAVRAATPTNRLILTLVFISSLSFGPMIQDAGLHPGVRDSSGEISPASYASGRRRRAKPNPVPRPC
jgi:hypothetical protein